MTKPKNQCIIVIMITRSKEIKIIRRLLRDFPVVGIIGARQVGKTTLAKQIVESLDEQSTFFDLENPEDQARLTDPMLALKDLKGLVILDEIQRKPDIFPVIRVLADKKSDKLKFLILGSASPELLKQSSETLAGRVYYHQLHGFSLEEVGDEDKKKLWIRGTFPRSFLASSQETSYTWRQSFIRTYLERDIPQLGIKLRAERLYRFWNMLAHYHGNTWNASEIGRSFGVADTTVRNYLDLMTATFVIRQLLPWHENIKKRQVKSPKVYISDSGLLHNLLNIRTHDDLMKHPKVGASWEGYIIEELIKKLGVERQDCYYWATYSGAELDLLIVHGSKRLGFEVKLTTSPKITASMKSAISTLHLSNLDIIYAGEKSYRLSEKIRALSINDFSTKIQSL
ncbi:MAG: ATP-binding protein [Candidatus Delongbacteria bacterium]